MLSTLHIENIAIIDMIDIDFSKGFNILTGQTGAGKSILIDSINLLLGNKAKSDMIGNNKDFSCVWASFYDLPEPVISILKENDIECDDELIIYRKITSDGRNISKINSVPVTVTILKRIAPFLVSIHGQHDNALILQQDNHINYLDSFLKLDDKLKEYKNQYDKVRLSRQKIVKLKELNDNKEEKINILNFKIKEIEECDFKEGEYDKLKAIRGNVINSEVISSSINYSLENLYDKDESVLSVLNQVKNKIYSLSEVENNATDLKPKIDNIIIEINDICDTLRQISSNVEGYSYSVDFIEQRLATLEKIKASYGPNDKDVLNNLNKFKDELENINENDDLILKANVEFKENLDKLDKIGHEISEKRKKGAVTLSKKIEEEIAFLDMKEAKFSVLIEDKLNQKGNKVYSKIGFDNVSFMISTNKGQPLKPLAKIASGGEMSRIMLALKNVLSLKDDCNCLIFDEIDTGVSGSTAQKIGLKLKEVSSDKQVLCITHLAQIASLADSHYLIEKKTSDKNTVSSVKKLDYDERITELSRIIGGINITDSIIKTAKDMLMQNN